jgi:hypothetical protein
MEGILMRQIKSRLMALTLVLVLALTLCIPALAVDKSALKTKVTESAEYMLGTVKNPQVGSIGGEWAIIGLARSGYNVPDEYYQDYYATVEAYVKACEGVLHDKKYTDYSRVTVALSAIGNDPRNVGGYNLLTPLGDFDKTIWQGINGPIWALIALDSGNYAMPQNPNAETQATRQMYIDEILSRQLADGGWSLNGKGGASTPSDPDITGMALQALAKYQDQAAVKAATDEALDCMSEKQGTDGGFSSWGAGNSESAVQMLTALCELDIPIDDDRFVKNGQTILDNLLSFRNADGSFKHTAAGGGNNQMASEQGLYGLVAALRMETGKNSLYRMSDAISIGEGSGPVKGEGLPGKHTDVKAMPVTAPGTTFDDVVFSENITAIEALAARGIINGKSDTVFDPDANMTRAEFATIITRGLGLAAKDSGVFTDVAVSAWYAGFVGTANQYGIVNGVGDGKFNPGGTITRQEAATMVARAAKLCGMDTAMTAAETRDMLAQFGDYVTVADWAQDSLAFCYREGILDQSDLNVQPTKAILRGEIAQMLFNMLTKANLI